MMWNVEWGGTGWEAVNYWRQSMFGSFGETGNGWEWGVWNSDCGEGKIKRAWKKVRKVRKMRKVSEDCSTSA